MSAATIVDSGSAESGLVKEVEKGKSAKLDMEEAKEEQVQGNQRRLSVSSPVCYAPWDWYSSTNVNTTVDTNKPIQPEQGDLGAKSISEDVQNPEGRGNTLPASDHSPINPITTNTEANCGGEDTDG